MMMRPAILQPASLPPPDFSGSGFTEITPLPPTPQQPLAPLLSQEEALRSATAGEVEQSPQPLQPVTLQTGDEMSPITPNTGTIGPLMPWIIANIALIVIVFAAYAWFRWMLSPTRQLLILQTVAYRIVGRRGRVLKTLSAASGLDRAIILTSPGAMNYAISKSAPLLDIASTNDLARQAFNQTLIETKSQAAQPAQSQSKKPLKPGTPGAPAMTIRKPVVPRKLGIAGGLSSTSAPAQSRGGTDGRASGSSPRK
jgi:hypothetical protein